MEIIEELIDELFDDAIFSAILRPKDDLIKCVDDFLTNTYELISSSDLESKLMQEFFNDIDEWELPNAKFALQVIWNPFRNRFPNSRNFYCFQELIADVDYICYAKDDKLHKLRDECDSIKVVYKQNEQSHCEAINRLVGKLAALVIDFW